MAFSLRLPPILDRQARAKADQLGLPLNGLICVALDAFLNGGGSPLRSVPAPVDDIKPVSRGHGGTPLRSASSSPDPAPTPLASAPLGRAERRKLAQQGRHQRK